MKTGKCCRTIWKDEGEMMKTTNEYWIFLENLRKSGITNMYGASSYLKVAFGLTEHEAQKILTDWMHNYNPDDYEDGEE